jgi:hypothetical protein
MGLRERKAPVSLVGPVAPDTSKASRWTDIHNPEGPTYRGLTGVRESRDETTFIGENHEEPIAQHMRRPEPKSADLTGQPCSRRGVGLISRRHFSVTETNAVGKEANELDLTCAGLIAAEDEFLTECPRDTRDFLPEIPPLTPARPIQAALKCSHSCADSLRNGQQEPAKKHIDKAMALAGRIARNKLKEFNRPRIPTRGEEATLRLANCLRNRRDPSHNQPATSGQPRPTGGPLTSRPITCPRKGPTLPSI